MKEVISTTLDELNQLEQQYSPKNRRKSGDLRNRIGDDEKVVFCYYRIKSGDILFCILTDIKLIFTPFEAAYSIWDIQLNEVRQVIPNSGFLSLGGVTVGATKGSATVFQGIKDSDFLQNISGIIQKAKANLDVRLRSSTININAPQRPSQESIAEQLAKLADLHKSGVLTDDEFKRAKERVISGAS